MSKHRILFLDFLVLLSIFFLAKIFLPLPWISDSRRLSRRIHNASASWKKGPKSPVNSSSLVLLCPPSSLYDLSPPSNGLVYMSIFLPSWHFSHFPKIEFRWPFSPLLSDMRDQQHSNYKSEVLSNFRFLRNFDYFLKNVHIKLDIWERYWTKLGLRGHSITTWTRGGGGGSKTSSFLSTYRVKNVHVEGGRGSKRGKIMSTWLLNDP